MYYPICLLKSAIVFEILICSNVGRRHSKTKYFKKRDVRKADVQKSASRGSQLEPQTDPKNRIVPLKLFITIQIFS